MSITNTVRFDMPSIDASDSSTSGDAILNAVLSELKRISKEYYIQYEEGEETGKPHYQGWCKHDLAEGTFRKNLGTICTKFGLDYKKKEYCFTQKRIANYYSYILNNPAKPERTKFYTSLSDKDLEEIIERLPVYVDNRVKKNKKPQKSWWDNILEENEQYIISEDLKGVKKIDYKKLEEIILNTTPKSLDVFVFKRLLVGFTNYLETKYPNKHNRRAKDYLRQEIKNDVNLHEIFYT